MEFLIPLFILVVVVGLFGLGFKGLIDFLGWVFGGSPKKEEPDVDEALTKEMRTLRRRLDNYLNRTEFLEKKVQGLNSLIQRLESRLDSSKQSETPEPSSGSIFEPAKTQNLEPIPSAPPVPVSAPPDKVPSYLPPLPIEPPLESPTVIPSVASDGFNLGEKFPEKSLSFKDLPPLEDSPPKPQIAMETVVVSLPPATLATIPTTDEEVLPATSSKTVPPPIEEKSFLENIDWENFLGVKMFAWLGGIALFLGISFFVKYSIENDLIPLEVRFVIGLIVGLGCIAGGLYLNRSGKAYEMTVDALCASGIAILYADIIAARYVLYLEVYTILPAMVIVTIGAFLLSVNLNSRFVAILGLVGGFITPPILSTGHDNPLGLFGYIALLDIGLLAVAIRQKWGFLVLMGALGTFVTQLGWVSKFFIAAKLGIAWWVFAGFALLFTAGRKISESRYSFQDDFISFSSEALTLASYWFVALLLLNPITAQFPLTIFSLAFLLLLFHGIQIGSHENDFSVFQWSAGISFLAILYWLGRYFVPDFALEAAGILVCFSTFVVLHARHPAIASITATIPFAPHRWFPVAATIFSWKLFTYASFGEAPIFVFSIHIIFLIQLAWNAWKEESSVEWHLAGGLSTFGVLLFWSANYLDRVDLALGYPLLLAFPLLYLGFWMFAEQREKSSWMLGFGTRSALLLGYAFAAVMILIPSLGAHPGLFISFSALLTGILTWQNFRHQDSSPFYCLGGIFQFILLWLWTGQHFSPDSYWLCTPLFLGFSWYFVGIAEWARLRGTYHQGFLGPAIFFPLFSFSFLFYLLDFPTLATQPSLVLWPIFLLDLGIAWMTLRHDEARPVHFLAGIISFLLLMKWTHYHLSDQVLISGLFFYFIFALLHAAMPILMQRLRPESSPYLLGHVFPPLIMLLMVFPIVRGLAFNVIIWPMALLINVVGLVAAFLMAWVWAGITLLIVSMGLMGFWAYHLADASQLPTFLIVEIVMSLLFHSWGLFLWKSKGRVLSNAGDIWKTFSDAVQKPVEENWREGIPEKAADKPWEMDPLNLAVLPSLSAFLPFALILLVVARLPLPDPSLVFGLCFLMSLMLMRLVQVVGMETTLLVNLLSVLLVQFAWHQKNFSAVSAWIPLSWNMAFLALFLLFPFVFPQRFLARPIPWITAGIAGPASFYLMYQSYTAVFGSAFPGILPALLALPYLWALRKSDQLFPEGSPQRLNTLALFGGVSLFFITLVFPLQFDREWLTIAWALEGTALLWLFQGVPHEGLRAWGIALLLIAFARLANPAIFSYYPRQAIPVLNWYLYTFGVTSTCLIAAGYLLKPPRDYFMEVCIQPWFYFLGALLAFFLLNIEIADYYSTGQTIMFEFSGAALERNAAYSCGWSLFAFLLLVVGIKTGSRGARLGSVFLLTVTIFKVFLYDLWSLGGLYRVASLVGLAGALILVSFLFQKFVKPQNTADKDLPA